MSSPCLAKFTSILLLQQCNNVPQRKTISRSRSEILEIETKTFSVIHTEALLDLWRAFLNNELCYRVVRMASRRTIVSRVKLMECLGRWERSGMEAATSFGCLKTVQPK